MSGPMGLCILGGDYHCISLFFFSSSSSSFSSASTYDVSLDWPRSRCVDQADNKLQEFCLPLSPGCWEYKQAPASYCFRDGSQIANVGLKLAV